MGGLRAEAQDLRKGRVGVQNPAAPLTGAELCQPETLVHALRDLAEAGFALPQRLLRQDPVGDLSHT